MNKSPFETLTYIETNNRELSHSDQDLVLFLKAGGIIVALLSKDRQLVFCKEFFNSDQLSTEIFLRILFEKEALLQQAYRSFHILSGRTNFALAPKSAVSERQLLHYARLSLDEALFEEEFLNTSIKKPDSWAIFSSPFSIKHILDEYAPRATYGHVCERVIDLAIHLEVSACALLLIYDHSVLITICKEAKLQLCNSYQIRANADILYFLHSARKATELVSDELPIFIMGELDGKMSYLKEHIAEIQVPQTLNKYLPDSPSQDMPYWQFAFLAAGG